MKKAMVVLMAVSFFATAVPSFAMEHGGSHDPADVQCQKECDMLLKDCAKDVDTIQQKLKKLKVAIKKDGADQQKLDEIKALKVKLDETKALLKSLEKPGK
jgi:hypothetical protein